MELYNSLILDPLKKLYSESPEFIVLDGKMKISARELFETSQSLAVGLKKSNFKEGDIVAMVIEPGPEFLKIIYALLMLHAKIAIIDPEMGRENYAAKMLQLQPNWMFVDNRLLFLDENPLLKKIALRFRKKMPDINFIQPTKIISVGKNLPLRKKYKKLTSFIDPQTSNVLFLTSGAIYENFIVYTSGTLSEPKGVLHSDKSLNKTLFLLSKVLSANQNDIVGTYLPHFMLLGIASGITVKIMEMNTDAKSRIEWFNKEKISVFFGPPSDLLPLIIYCEKNNLLFPFTLKHLLLGSAPVHSSFLKRLIAVLPNTTKISCTYGMTEHLLVAVADGRLKVSYECDGDFLGAIMNEVEVKINEDHEILVKSEQLYSRYFHKKENDEWHLTGDYGKIDDNGNLILMGRKKEMIIRRDFNIYPALYEGTIKKIEGINEAALVGIYDETKHDEVVCLVVDTELNDFSHIYELLKKGEYSIDQQALPDYVVKMNIPRKGRQNKIDRSAIIERIRRKIV